MTDTPRARRLRSDLKALAQLKSESTIFDFEPFGTPPDHFVLVFRGRGVFRPENASDVLTRDHHEVVLRLGAGYPRNAPGLTWRTPIFHPNIASSGVVCLGAYGQHWAPSVTLDELCHMLWDMLRYANYDVESPYNREAASWTRNADKATFPFDERPLRNITAGALKTHSAVPQPHIPLAKLVSPVEGSQNTSSEVIYIAEENEEVVEAEIVESAPPLPTQFTNDEILYIS